MRRMMMKRVILLACVLVCGLAFAQDMDLPDFGPRPQIGRPDKPEFPEDPPATPPPPPPPKIFGEDMPTETLSVVYVLDLSGSMDWGTSAYTDADGNHTQGTKLDRAKAELVRSIQGLTEDYRFQIVVYTCSVAQWRAEPVQATPGNKQAAKDWVLAQHTGGATGTGPATVVGLKDKKNLLVVLISDGAPNCGATGYEGHRRMISAANSQQAKIHTFGIDVNGRAEEFMRNVADDSGGTFHKR